jgi:uncharacterized membrane protein
LILFQRNGKSGFGRKNKQWQDESINSKWILMGLCLSRVQNQGILFLTLILTKQT